MLTHTPFGPFHPIPLFQTAWLQLCPTPNLKRAFTTSFTLHSTPSHSMWGRYLLGGVVGRWSPKYEILVSLSVQTNTNPFRLHKLTEWMNECSDATNKYLTILNLQSARLVHLISLCHLAANKQTEKKWWKEQEKKQRRDILMVLFSLSWEKCAAERVSSDRTCCFYSVCVCALLCTDIPPLFIAMFILTLI